MTPTKPARDFVTAYERALRTQDWDQIAPLICEDAVVIFSNGARHAGKGAIRAAYQRNFEAIQGEDYRIEDVHWLAETGETAAYSFSFRWTGVIDGRAASGSGRGMAVVILRDGKWQLIGEQLGPKS